VVQNVRFWPSTVTVRGLAKRTTTVSPSSIFESGEGATMSRGPTLRSWSLRRSPTVPASARTSVVRPSTLSVTSLLIDAYAAPPPTTVASTAA
jgi:hypothetical protein